MTIAKATGSSDNPVQDGLSRGVWTTAINSGAAGVMVQIVGVDASDYLSYIAPVVLLVSFISWGVFDRYVKPKLPAV